MNLALCYTAVMHADGRLLLDDYQRLKGLIQTSAQHTVRDGDAVVVKESIRHGEDARVREKIRGGMVAWEPRYLGQPTTRVDDDPRTFDRISVEREVDGDVVSIIYAERLVDDLQGQPILILEKWERYARADERGERYVRVHCETAEILEERHTPDPV